MFVNLPAERLDAITCVNMLRRSYEPTEVEKVLLSFKKKHWRVGAKLGKGAIQVVEKRKDGLVWSSESGAVGEECLEGISYLYSAYLAAVRGRRRVVR